MYRDTLTHSTLPTCTRSGAAKSTPTVNGTPLRPPWDGSHILPPYEIFPLPACGVVGVWYCPSPPPGVVLSLSPPCGVVGVWYCPPPLPVVWWGCGTVPLPPCGVVGMWYGMLGMYGVYGRSGMACLESMVCLVCMVGMLCMA